MASKFKVGDIVRLVPEWDESSGNHRRGWLYKITRIWQDGPDEYSDGPTHELKRIGGKGRNAAYADQIMLDPFMQAVVKAHEQQV